MRIILMFCAALALGGCGSGGSGVDFGVGSPCAVGAPDTCPRGLVCCPPCHGTPPPADLGPIHGTCATACPIANCS